MKETNYTNTKVFKMSIPIFIELLLQLLVGNIDQFMISQYSQNSVAAIGNGNQIMNIIIIVLNVMSISTTILITQYLGADNKKKISEVSSVSVLMIGLFSLITTILLLGFNKGIFLLLNVPDEIMNETCSYISIIGSFIVVQGLYMTMAAILRSYSLMKEVMFSAIIMNLINILGNAVLINGLLGMPRLGIMGAAISTNISKCIGLIIVISLFIRKVDSNISITYFKPFPWKTLRRLLFISIPSGGQELAYNLSQMCILMFINSFGTAVITTKVYASMLANIAYVYSIAISQATQIVIGYLIGSNKTETVSRRVWSTVMISIIVSVSITFIIYLNSDFIFGIFTDNPEVISLGRKIIFIELFLETGRAVNIVMTKCLVAAGDVQMPAITSLIFSWAVAVTGSYILGVRMSYGLAGIWIAMALDECIRAVIFAVRFKKGAWKKKVLI